MAAESKLEYRKLFYDAMKHLATLSSAGAGLVVTFADRLFPEPEWPFLIVARVLAFLAALTASMMVMFHLATEPSIAAVGVKVRVDRSIVGRLTNGGN